MGSTECARTVIWNAPTMMDMTYDKHFFRSRRGHEIHIRPTTSDDAKSIVEFLGQLSPQTRYMRYFTPCLPVEIEAARLLHTPGHSLVALTGDEYPSRIVAIAELARNPSAAVAEIALVVADDYQGQGIGSALSLQLADAAVAHGINEVEVMTLSGNVAIRRLIEKLGMPFAEKTFAGITTFRLHTGAQIGEPAIGTWQSLSL